MVTDSIPAAPMRAMDSKRERRTMVRCAHCGKSLDEKEALRHKKKDGGEEIICRDCFKEITGIDYQTFAYRRENAKQTIFAVVFCLAATVYAFVEKGALWGVLGLVLTVLVYLFASKAR